MKNFHFLLISILLLFSCNESTENKHETNLETDSNIVPTIIHEPEITQIDDSKYKYGFFMINVSASADRNEAVYMVQELQGKGHPAGYLWLPDYESLSNKELYSVFIGPFDNMDTCIKYLVYYQKEDPKAYAVKAKHNKKRITIHNNFDIRINNKRQYLILTYSTPEDSEEYAENGGEDWGWFVNDVDSYFSNYHEGQVYFSSVYYSWFTKKDIAKLVKELDLEGFGYILVKGKEKTFISHDMSDNIISQACDFFGFEMKENWQEEINK